VLWPLRHGAGLGSIPAICCKSAPRVWAPRRSRPGLVADAASRPLAGAPGSSGAFWGCPKARRAEVTWDEIVRAVTSGNPDVAPSIMFGLPCLKGADGKVIACLTRDGGINVKLVDERARAQALAVAGAAVATHAYDSSRSMKQWVYLPSTQARAWLELVERSLQMSNPRSRCADQR
jgi:hypothetical protein